VKSRAKSPHTSWTRNSALLNSYPPGGPPLAKPGSEESIKQARLLLSHFTKRAIPADSRAKAAHQLCWWGRERVPNRSSCRQSFLGQFTGFRFCSIFTIVRFSTLETGTSIPQNGEQMSLSLMLLVRCG